MLTQQELLRLIGRGEAGVSYYFDPTVRSPTVLTSPWVTATDPDESADRAFADAMFGDRLRLTLGPLLLSHTHRWSRGRKGYKSFANVFDLRETGGHLDLRPGESATINTIERVRLSGGVGALILPRLSHATAGLVLAPSYIDPHWDGILALQLVNASRRRYTLRFGERIAVCLFYRVDGEPLDDEFRAHFAGKSHHYGLSWERIEASDADPFPLGKRPTGRAAVLDEARGLARTTGARLGAAGITAAAVISGAVAYGGLSERLSSVEDLDRRVEKLSEAPVASASSGEVTLTIKAGRTRASRDIQLDSVRTGAVPLAQPSRPSSGYRISAKLVPSPSGRGVVLRLGVQRSRRGSADAVSVRWAVL